MVSLRTSGVLFLGATFVRCLLERERTKESIELRKILMTAIRPGHRTGQFFSSVVRLCECMPRLNTYAMSVMPVGGGLLHAYSSIYLFLLLTGSISTLPYVTLTI